MNVVEMGDLREARAQSKVLRQADVVIPREQIAEVTMKRPNMLTNGNLIVTTTRGRRYQLHFLRKHAPDFEALHSALVSHPAT